MLYASFSTERCGENARPGLPTLELLLALAGCTIFAIDI